MEVRNYNVSKRIYELREKNGWSQRELAKRMGLSQSTINKYESGEYKLQKLKVAAKFINVLDTSFDYLFQDFLNVFQKNILNNFEKEIKIELSKMDIEKLKICKNILDVIIKYQNIK